MAKDYTYIPQSNPEISMNYTTRFVRYCENESDPGTFQTELTTAPFIWGGMYSTDRPIRMVAVRGIVCDDDGDSHGDEYLANLEVAVNGSSWTPVEQAAAMLLLGGSKADAHIELIRIAREAADTFCRARFAETPRVVAHPRAPAPAFVPLED